MDCCGGPGHAVPAREVPVLSSARIIREGSARASIRELSSERPAFGFRTNQLGGSSRIGRSQSSRGREGLRSEKRGNGPLVHPGRVYHFGNGRWVDPGGISSGGGAVWANGGDCFAFDWEKLSERSPRRIVIPGPGWLGVSRSITAIPHHIPLCYGVDRCRSYCKGP
jgi:hypothetical protein